MKVEFDYYVVIVRTPIYNNVGFMNIEKDFTCNLVNSAKFFDLKSCANFCRKCELKHGRNFTYKITRMIAVTEL